MCIVDIPLNPFSCFCSLSPMACPEWLQCAADGVFLWCAADGVFLEGCRAAKMSSSKKRNGEENLVQLVKYWRWEKFEIVTFGGNKISPI